MTRSLSLGLALAGVLKRVYDIPVQQTPQGRRTLAAYAALVTEIARTARTLERLGEPALAASLVRYASEVTDMACEHARKSGEIAP